MASVPGSPGNGTAVSAARTFLRSLSILLKYARLYGFAHARTTAQCDSTWNELCAALPQESGSGLLIGVAGERLLIDGVPVEAGSADRGITQLLAGAGLASIHFTSGVTREDFNRLVRAFISPAGKPTILAEQIRHAVGPQSDGTIRVNEIRFVATDKDGELAHGLAAAAQVAAISLGEEGGSTGNGSSESWFSSPQKLLQMIAAAHASPSTETGMFQAPAGHLADGTGAGQAVDGAPAQAPTDTAATEEEILQVIRLFSSFGEASQRGDKTAQDGVRQQLSSLGSGTKSSLEEVLRALTPNAPSRDAAPLLVQIAEHLAIRFALERYERGDVKVNAVREMLDRMNHELDSLRKVLNAHESKMVRAGVEVESHLDILDREFWASVPESGKEAVLLSGDGWCIPPKNIASYVDELQRRGDKGLAQEILQSYASCVTSDDKEARTKTAIGMSQLAESYGKAGDALRYAIAKLGEQLSQEADPDLQKLLSATFTRLSQEAATRHEMAALLQAMASLDVLEESLPELAGMMRPCIGVHDRLPEFIAGATAAPRVPSDLLEVLRTVPEASLDRLLQRFDAATRRDECDRIFELAKALGPAANEHLYEKFSQQPPAQAVLAVGMLSRVDPKFLGELLPGRLAHWARPQHDAVVRQIASAGAADRGKLLLKIIDSLDPVLLPEVIDELGMSGEREAYAVLMKLVNYAEPDRSPYNRVKALEALGRLREARAEKDLQTIVEARHMFHWAYPRELRIAAAQALLMIDPQRARQFVESKGITANDLAFGPLNVAPFCPWARQRRYTRVVSAAPVTAVLATGKGRFSKINVSKLSLGGGYGAPDGRMQPGSEAAIELQAGKKKVKAQIYTREVDKNVSFEFVTMELDERSKLRRMLAEDLGAPQPGFFRQMAGLRQIRAS
ncbi:MAG: hypothetical protein L0Z53_09455 [Acidobacteriales bacterium]|nr:hypothetical protein [Terriglobales bacterium]